MTGPVRRWIAISVPLVITWAGVVYLTDHRDWTTLALLPLAALFYWVGRPTKGSDKP